MQLYFSPFACSLASHITAREAGVPLDLVSVSLSKKTTGTGGDYLAVSPKGQVPALRLDDGSLLTENSAVMQYLADRAGRTDLLPPVGARDRYAVLEWLSYIGTEIHKQCFFPMFAPDTPPEAKAWSRGALEKKLAYVNSRLAERQFIATNDFTIADSYLTWALTLCTKIGASFDTFPNVAAYLQRMHARSPVQEAIAAETVAAKAAS